MTYDVIVVGAGPVGSAAARECARLGLSVLCLEEHGTIGHPVQCTGLLSTAAFAECRVTEHSVLNRVQGAFITSGRGTEIRIDGRTTKAFVVDRGILDREMATLAADDGAEFQLKTTVCGIRNHHLLTRGAYGHQEFPFRILIAADGPRSTIARMRGMARAPVYLAGIQADLPGECDPRFVHIYPDASPGFFGWSVPLAPGRIRIGLCAATDAAARFQAFSRKFGSANTHLVTGTLPLGIMPKTYGHRTLFTGDAAGLAKPTSGGGIYTGVRSARHAAAVAADACETKDLSDTALAAYERRWKEDFGRELALGFRLFSLRQKISPDEMDDLIRVLGNPDIIRIIEEHGDMDRPGSLVRKLLIQPALLGMISPLIRTGIRSLFFP